MFYVVIAIVFACVWGVTTRAVILNKGYEYEGTKWFWLGFCFGLFALIVALSKSAYRKPEPQLRSTQNLKRDLDRDREILRNKGWRCTCGRVNQDYVSSCVCGKSRRDLEVGKNETSSTEIIEKKEASARGTIEKTDVERIREFKELLDSGIITQEEFDAKKKQLLGL